MGEQPRSKGLYPGLGRGKGPGTRLMREKIEQVFSIIQVLCLTLKQKLLRKLLPKTNHVWPKGQKKMISCPRKLTERSNHCVTERLQSKEKHSLDFRVTLLSIVILIF